MPSANPKYIDTAAGVEIKHCGDRDGLRSGSTKTHSAARNILTGTECDQAMIGTLNTGGDKAENAIRQNDRELYR